jgi:Cu2+-exporting ATPase
MNMSHGMQVVEAVVLGRATLSKIRQNLAWALLYNVVGIPLAAGALLPSAGLALNPSAAGGLMAMSSLAVVSNSLLLRTHSLQGGSGGVGQSRGSAQGGQSGMLEPGRGSGALLDTS